jgi:hypothetical protein
MADLWGWFTGDAQKKKARSDLQTANDAADAQAAADLANQYGQVKTQTDASNNALFGTMRENTDKALSDANRTAMGAAGARGMAGGAGATVGALSQAADESQKGLNRDISNIQGSTNERLANMLFGGQQNLSAQKRAGKQKMADINYENANNQASPMDWTGKALKAGSQLAGFF